MSQAQNAALKLEISESMTECKSQKEIASAVANRIRAMAFFKQAWPGLENVLLSSLKRREGSMRMLMTERMARVLVQQHLEGPELAQATKSFRVVQEEVLALSKDVKKLCTHLEYVFGPLFNSLIHTK
eukprot:TRINITY_DN18050_c0_g1_i2.p1 TRINITY_DN18050_c0_g1~~TRINITY_DN18050_c0_g1_i2.p1  ORF type:complete len:128 (+),score=22.93 TRINITY_DN18050_c0_g1_i2:132-515(+)